VDAIRSGNHATADIADAVGVTRQAADEQLRKLEDDAGMSQRRRSAIACTGLS
jgi:predicted transcriptional regulator